MVFLSNFPESKAECASCDSSLLQPSPFRFAGAGKDPFPPCILSAVARAFGCYGKFHFLLLWLPVAACGSLCERKDILLILVVNPLGISETGAKTVRKVWDATAFTSPSLQSHHQTLIVSSLPSLFQK